MEEKDLGPGCPKVRALYDNGTTRLGDANLACNLPTAAKADDYEKVVRPYSTLFVIEME